MKQEKEFATQDFDGYYDSYHTRVYNTSLSFVRNREDAEEIAQDVFVEIYFMLQRGASVNATLIYRITVSRSVDRLKYRRRSKRYGVLSRLTGNEAAGEADIPDFHHPGVALEQKEAAAILFRAIDRLPLKQQTAFLLSKAEGLSHAEIAGIMKKSASAVESLISRATSGLRKMIDRNSF